MDIIDFRGGEPVYVQLKEKLRKYIISGIFKSDERVPSVRELAAGLSVNPNTIQRAYRELEDEGYIYTVSGRGSFASRPEQVMEKREGELMRRFSEAAGELLFLGKSKAELIAQIEREADK